MKISILEVPNDSRGFVDDHYRGNATREKLVR